MQAGGDASGAIQLNVGGQAQEIGGNGVDEYVGPQSRIRESDGALVTAGTGGDEKWSQAPSGEDAGLSITVEPERVAWRGGKCGI